MREIELKLLLEADEHARLARAWGEPDARLDQRNEYFDDPGGGWRAAGFAVRLREVDGRGTLTIKGESVSREGWTDRFEVERGFDATALVRLRGEASALDRAARSLLGERAEGLPRLPAHPIATLHNERWIYLRPVERAELALDRSSYPDASVGYELELEAADAEFGSRAEQSLRELFAELGIPWRPGGESKFARLMRMTQ